VDAVVLDGEREDEAAEHEGDDVVHVGLGDGVGVGDAERGEEEERRHGRDGEGHGVRDPPEEHPRQHAEHVARRGAAAEVHQPANERARQRPRRHGQVLAGEQRPEPLSRRPELVHRQKRPAQVLRRGLPEGARRVHGR
jgi:hypothetical protein